MVAPDHASKSRSTFSRCAREPPDTWPRTGRCTPTRPSATRPGTDVMIFNIFPQKFRQMRFFQNTARFLFAKV
jgi:hypothetical protein